ncbi:hypothetical protein I3760_14G047500 [Carya illinoinensis]|uniref:DUF538 domain-containing protein n=1 Tax=Carya illinoinensis TaxID=32201 RepID=A0A922AF93_CARIL|nr:hypothetical protein I3760_14G047500 [Carya illinoinensis]KAG6677851.1 hypothetical protein I3842_14G047800 [Carya illinoinensis]KAG6677852.1 hypothetical protein I3842_14G047800 [Carya illinoinensis]
MLPFLWLSFLSLISYTSIPISSAEDSPLSSTIYEVLREHGLPMGLLPKGVREFDIDETGRFHAHFDQACNAQFESQLHYDRNVSGTLSYGQIGALSGISAQELFLWFPVKGIRVDIPSSGLIYFDVGVVDKQFSLSLFETPPDCMAMRTVNHAQLPDGSGFIVADAMPKFQTQIQSGELRYQLDQDSSGRDFE